MMRKTALVGLGVLLLTFAGCLIKTPTTDQSYLSVIRIRPDNNLQAAPENWCYELWFLDINDFNNPTEQTFTPIIRFQWDPVDFRTLDETGSHEIPLYTQTGKGMDVGQNFLDHFIVLMSIEPVEGDNPNTLNGPIVGLFLDVSSVQDSPSPLQVNHEGTMQLDFPFAGLTENAGGASATLVAQSLTNRLRQEGENVCWRGSTEGMGIWFGHTQIQNRIIEDTAGVAIDPTATTGRGTMFTRNIDKNGDGIKFNIWIFPDHPESSWSNFDNVFSNRTPDVVFLDGVPQRTDVLPPPSSGVNALGSHPLVDNGNTIGYLYFPDTIPLTPGGTDYRDTCFLRVDNPAFSYCSSDSDLSYIGQPFADTNLIIRVFTDTWADTVITPSLTALPVHRISFALEYEAWLVFDSVNNPIYKPLSLGRFSPLDISGATYTDSLGHEFPGPDGICDGAQTFDGNNQYTDPVYFDSNFAYPGEDFVYNQPEGLSELDVLHPPSDINRISLWITMEPVIAPQAGFDDWAPDMPFSQLVTFVGVITPDLDSDTLTCNRDALPYAPETYSIPLQYRPITRSRTDPAEGNDWPTVKFFISSPEESSN